MTRWPRMPKRQTAAEYCELSVAAFERQEAGRGGDFQAGYRAE